MRVLLDQPPATLNPRLTLDATSQRLSALIFRGLTRIDRNLNPQPDLTEKWEQSPDGKRYRFWIRQDLTDQGGEKISPEKIAQCLEAYRTAKPYSPHRESFRSWIATEADSRSVSLLLSKPDPYLPRNISLLRYFREQGADTPCAEPKRMGNVIASGDYKPTEWPDQDSGAMTLEPVSKQKPPIQFNFVRDDNTKLLKLMRGEADAVSTMPWSKIRYLEHNHPDQFRTLEREGVAVSYLAFNVKDPILSHAQVRLALAKAIPKRELLETKYAGMATEASSFLAPALDEALAPEFRHDVKEAERLLNEAGFPRGAGGLRFTLRYKTTPLREAYELAQILRDVFLRVGVDLRIEVVETAVFFASIRKGNFQIYSSRWVGVADGSILYRTLYSSAPTNRVRYSNPEMDQWLDQAMVEPDLAKRAPLLRKAQARMLEDVPYFPLWFWKNPFVYRKTFTGVEKDDLSLSGAFEPFTHLR